MVMRACMYFLSSYVNVCADGSSEMQLFSDVGMYRRIIPTSALGGGEQYLDLQPTYQEHVH